MNLLEAARLTEDEARDYKVTLAQRPCLSSLRIAGLHSHEWQRTPERCYPV